MTKMNKASGPLLACALALAVTFAFIAFRPHADEAAAAGMPKPATHDQNWRTGHAAFGKTEARDCAGCHDQSYCTACHNSDNPKEGFHKANYVYTHYLDKFLDERECASCHDNQTFCVACHWQFQNKSGALKPLYHNDPGWAASRHAAVARDDLDACASCHDSLNPEPVCLRCHRTVSPHADMSLINAMGKGPWHDNADYVCFKCHDRGDDFCGRCHDDDGGEGPEGRGRG